MKQHTHIGVYALVKDHSKVLCIKKARGPYTGKWDLPGGGFEFGETPVQTLHREFKEETGMSISESILFDVFSHTEIYKNHTGEQEKVHHIGAIYRVIIDPQSKKLKEDGDGEDSLGAKWIEYSSVNEDTFSPFAKKCIQYMKNCKMP